MSNYSIFVHGVTISEFSEINLRGCGFSEKSPQKNRICYQFETDEFLQFQYTCKSAQLILRNDPIFDGAAVGLKLNYEDKLSSELLEKFLPSRLFDQMSMEGESLLQITTSLDSSLNHDLKHFGFHQIVVLDDARYFVLNCVAVSDTVIDAAEKVIKASEDDRIFDETVFRHYAIRWKYTSNNISNNIFCLRT